MYCIVSIPRQQPELSLHEREIIFMIKCVCITYVNILFFINQVNCCMEKMSDHILLHLASTICFYDYGRPDGGRESAAQMERQDSEKLVQWFPNLFNWQRP